MTCKTCKWLRVQPDARGRIVVRKGSVHPCEAPTPDVSLPASITKHYGWRWPPVTRSWMGPEEGEGCPAHQKREKP
jgi:hypothetical protein